MSHAEKDASFISRLFFAWVWPVLRQGLRTTLQQRHLPALLHSDAAAVTYPKFRDAWQGRRRKGFCQNLAAQVTRKRPRTLRAAHISVADTFVPAALWKVLFLAAAIGQVFAIRALVDYVQQRAFNGAGRSSASLPVSKWVFVPVVVAMALCSVFMSISQHQVFFGSMRSGMRVRAALSAAIYRKVLRLSPDSIAMVSDGSIANLLLNDTHRVLESFFYLHFCWFGFIEIVVISGLLWLDLGISVLFILAVLVFLIPTQIFFSVLVARARTRVMKESDVRVHTMSELLSSIRMVKLSAWETHFERIIAECRAREAHHLRAGVVMRAINTAIFFVARLFVALAAFTAYTLLVGQTLTPSVAFASVSYFSIISRALALMPHGWLASSEASNSYRRLDAFLALPELPSVDCTERFDEWEPETASGLTGCSRKEHTKSADDQMAGEDSRCTDGHPQTANDYGPLHQSKRISQPPPDRVTVANSLAAPPGTVTDDEQVSGETSSALECPTDNAPHEINQSARIWANSAQFEWLTSGKGPETGPQDLTTVLYDVSFSIASGELVAVVGQVGSGKSSLLLGLLGEMHKSTGSCGIRGTVAYCAQTPWIINGTLRENVTLFGDRSPGKEAWYSRVIEACCLLPDLESLPAGDNTEIGERGINLSGGQKARVSLARAVYADADNYLIDDPLSAVDSVVANQLRSNVLGPGGLLARKARIVVTHNSHLLPLANCVMVLQDGHIAHCGTYEDLRAQEVHFAGVWDDDESDHRRLADTVDYADSEAAEDDARVRNRNERTLQKLLEESSVFNFCMSEAEKHSSKSDKAENGKIDKQDAKESPKEGDLWRGDSNTLEYNQSLQSNYSSARTGSLSAKADSLRPGQSPSAKLTVIEDRRVGRVTNRVYWIYIKAAGGLLALIFASLGFALAQAASQVAEWWLAQWSNDEFGWVRESSGKPSKGAMLYSLVFLGASIVTGVLTLLRAAFFAERAVVASKRLHNKLLAKVLHAKLAFFDTNPIGRILNRFSNDVDQADSLLPATAQDFVQIAFTALGNLITVGWIIPWLLIPLAPIVGLFLYLQHIYKMSSRELKRLEGISRSPICAHLTETIVGLDTIRAYNAQEKLSYDFDVQVDANHRVYHTFLCASRWLGINLDLLTAGVVLCTSCIILIISDKLNPGLAGLALTQCTLMTGVFQWGVRQAAETENLFTGVERMHAMTVEAPQEAAYIVASKTPPPEWPLCGVVSFENVQLRYRPELELVLHNLSFKTKPKEHLGIVGRTGSGKSSIFVALFRLVELSGGTIKIDDIDVSTIGLHDLRSRLAIVPQDPVLFKGTIRSNLDPVGEHTDAQLWDALHRVHMSSTLRSSHVDENSDRTSDTGYGLDTMVYEKGSNFSAGERQLLSLARAILSGVQVVVLDEASASLDNHTDMLIQRTVREQLSDRTVLTIAHRLATVADSDRILVMEDGEAVEFDTPQNLLAARGYFARLVQETGAIESAILTAMINGVPGA